LIYSKHGVSCELPKQRNALGPCDSGGFTLVEMIMTVVLVAVASLFAASMTGIAVSFFNRGRETTRIDAVIDQDFAVLERAAFQYTYCTGQYTWDGRACSGSSSGSQFLPGSQNYYFPPTTSGGSKVAAESFENDCKNGTMTDALRNEINRAGSSLGLPAEASSLGITRLATLPAKIDGIQPHRLIVSYTLKGSTVREKLLIPPAYYWCPDTEVVSP